MLNPEFHKHFSPELQDVTGKCYRAALRSGFRLMLGLAVRATASSCKFLLPGH